MRKIRLLFLVSLLCQFGRSQLQERIATAQPGDTLVVTGRIAEHNITINKPLYLEGRNAVIDVGKQGHGIIIKSDSVTVKGFTIQNIKISHTENYAAIYVSGANHYSIRDNLLENVFFGILLEKSNHGELRGNRIQGSQKKQHNSGNGIHGWYCKNLEIANNTLLGLRDGIYFEFVSKSSIQNNVVRKNLRYGLHFMFSNYNVFDRNVFSSNGSGVAIMFSNHIDMLQNEFSHNWGTHAYGLLLKEVADSSLQQNRFISNTIAINAEGLNRITYAKNIFEANGWALKFRGACYDNVFQNNNFMHNTFDVAYAGAAHTNVFNSNYWSNYRGYDINHDKIGDIPHHPVAVFSVISNRTPETLCLIGSLFIALLEVTERYTKVLTPKKIVDNRPLITPYYDSD